MLLSSVTLIEQIAFPILIVFLLPQLPHFLNLLGIKRLSDSKSAQHYRNITATLPQTLPQNGKKPLLNTLLKPHPQPLLKGEGSKMTDKLNPKASLQPYPEGKGGQSLSVLV